MSRLFLALLIFLSWPLPASAEPLVADLSHDRIDMDAQFSGSRMFLFGAREEAGDVVIVVRGPMRNFVMRKKENVGGIWINRGRMKLYGAPDFYAVASSRPLAEIPQTGLFKRLGIGGQAMLVPPYAGAPNFDRYAEAFLRNKQEQRLYGENTGEVKFMGDTLFKTAVDFPGNTPPGTYTAEIYLVRDGKVSGMQKLPITVVKIGIDAFLYAYAHRHPALYGLTAVVMALGIGWLAGRLFEKV